MDITLFIALAAPIIVALVVKFVFHQTITVVEAILQAVIVIAVVSGLWAIGRYSDTGDVELWNGEVTNKQVRRESCPWGWQDWQDGFCTEYNTRRVKDGPPRRVCTEDSKGKKSCRMEQDYKTQYKYIYPWEQKFYIHTNVKETFYIPRVDPQGARTPPFFARAFIGEPVAARKSYTNWIRGASNSIFHEDGAVEEKYKGKIPQYPNKVYDYYNVDRVVKIGNVDVPNFLNEALRMELKELGPQKQMNALFVIVDAKQFGPDYPYAVRRAWMGFKKNDAVVFLGMEGNVLKWAEVMSWSKKSIFDITLRNDLLTYENKQLDFMFVLSKLTSNAKTFYERRSMKEFEYLKDQIPVPTWLTITVFLLSFGGSAGLTFLFHRVDIANVGAFARHRRYR